MAIWVSLFSSVIVALIGGIFSYIGVAKTAKASHDASMVEIKMEQEKQSVKIHEQIEGIKEDINRLEKKQDKHNSIIERTFKLEQQVDDLEKRMNRTEVV
jgi:predicted transcriptional regulator